MDTNIIRASWYKVNKMDCGNLQIEKQRSTEDPSGAPWFTQVYLGQAELNALCSVQEVETLFLLIFFNIYRLNSEVVSTI